MLFVLLLSASLVGCVLTPRIWRGELLGRRVLPSDDDWVAAWVRVLPVCAVLALGFSLIYLAAVTTSSPEKLAPPAIRTLAIVWTFGGIVITGSIAAFNVPRFLVPPSRRDEEGVFLKPLQRRWKARRSGTPPCR